MKLYTLLATIFKSDSSNLKLIDNQGDLMLNKIHDLVDKTDENLIGLLLENQELREKFFIPLTPKGGNTVLVFKTYDFKFFLDENKIDNSYTQYENRIGLTAGRKFLKDSADVVLDFPYKDCILEGGQSTEEGTDSYFEYDANDNHYQEKKVKRKEIFFNIILAKDEIDRLLEPKAFTNIKKYTPNGVEFPSIGEVPKGRGGFFTRDENGTIKDNLIIKGNNLLALHTLKSEFAGKVKLIYIDPPYNTGSDSFAYNDNFNHSTWLTFMRNRLLIARELLREDGVIFVSIDDSEQAYLKVLMDEVFEKKHFITNFVWTRKRKGSFLSKKIRKMTEFIICFSKSEGDLSLFGEDAYSDKWQPIVKRTNSLKKLNFPKNIIKTTLKDGIYEKLYRGNNETGISFLNDFNVKDGLIVNDIEVEGKFVWTQQFLDNELINGSEISLSNKFGFNVLRYDQSEKFKAPSTIINRDNNVGTNEEATQELAAMFDVEIGTIFNYNKPVSLLKYLINMVCFEDKNAIVLDYHCGSGTTGHALLELNKTDDGNRKFIIIEQMDYAETVTAKRISKVIENNKAGSFVYLELAKNNQNAIEYIQSCENYEALVAFFDKMCDTYFLHYNVKVAAFREVICKEDNFKKLTLDQQKIMFAKMLDLNQLYVNVSDMKDSRFGLSENDIAITKDFYQI